MELHTITGKYFFSRLTDAKRFPLLVIGADRWSHQDVADIGIIQPKACSILSRIARDLKVKSLKDLYKHTSPYQLAGTHGCGVTTLYVLLRLFTVSGLSIDEWYSLGENKAIVTFNALKDREQKAEARTKEAERKRRRLRSRRQVTDTHATA